jgi:hypothetical protein
MGRTAAYHYGIPLGDRPVHESTASRSCRRTGGAWYGPDGSATEVLAVHDGLSPGLSPADNETGWRSSLAKLAALVEAGQVPLAAAPAVSRNVPGC